MSEIKKNAGLTPLLRQSFVTAGVSLNFIGHGCAIGFSTVLIQNLRVPDSPIHISTSVESWIASVLGLALIVGNITVTPIMETFGRKKSHLASLIPQLIGWAILCFTNNVAGIIIARLLQGIGMGSGASLGSIIIGETSEPKYRGSLLTFVSLSLSTGNLVSHTLGTFFTWRQTALICSSITFTSLVLIIFSPETPSWLIKQGRYDEGSKVFFWLRSHTDEQEMELEKMIMSQRMARKSSVEGLKITFCHKVRRFFTYLVVAFKKPEFYKPVTIAFLTYTSFQFAGINVLSSYALDIIKQLVGTEVDTGILMVALDIERLICNILAIFLMRVLRRRLLLFTCVAICVLSYLAKAFYLYAKNSGLLPKEYDSPWIPITLIAVYLFVVTVGISAIAFALPGEIMPLQYRGLGGGVSVLGLSLNFFVAVKCFPVLTKAIGLSLTYCVYAGVVAACQTVVFFLLPETKNRTLPDIEDSFKGLDKNAEDKSCTQPLKPIV